MTKAMRAFLTALDYGKYIMLVAFAIMFGFLALVAILSEFSIFSLFGFAGCAFASWTCWSIRKD